MKKFILGQEITLQEFYTHLYGGTSLLILFIALVEYFIVKIVYDSLSFPIIMVAYIPILLWVLTQVQFFRYKNLLLNQGKYKLMWILAAIPITYPYVYLLISMLPVLPLFLLFMIMNMFVV